MVTVSQYVMDFLVKKGIKDIFIVAGGGSMYLLDALRSNLELNYICNHHEQASAMSAEAYARVTGNFGTCLVSTGPATTNALTGVACAWNDSIPVMYVSGQANSKYLIRDTGMRQYGVHEAPIIPMVKPITKYAVMIENALNIRYELEKAYHTMMSGRKGPVWIDIPLDIQNTLINEDELPSYIPGLISEQKTNLQSIMALFNKSEKPALLIGAGCIDSIDDILQWVEDKNITLFCTKNIYGRIPRSHPTYMGMVGINGNRKANLALQDADFLMILGARMPLSTVGYAFDAFAPNAYKLRVDIDPIIIVNSFIKSDWSLVRSIKDFMLDLLHSDISTRESRYSAVYDEVEDIPNRQLSHKYVDSYNLYKHLSNYGIPVLVTDQGAAFYSWSQAYDVKPGGLSFTNGGFSPMGYGLPAAIGACVASKKPVVCVSGDGSLEMNIQELQTIVHYNLPIKILVFNNNGYGSITNTQDAFFNKQYIGSEPSSGLSIVNIEKIAIAYDIPFIHIDSDLELSKIALVLASPGPYMVALNHDIHQEIIPKVKGKRLEDGSILPGRFESMYP